MRGVAPMALLLLLGACASSAGRSERESPFKRLLDQRVTQLARDSQFLRAFAATNGRAPVEELPHQLLGRLSDADLVGFFDLYLRSLKKARPADCTAAVRQNSGTGFFQLANSMDSSLAVQWVAVFEKVVWTFVRNDPVGSLATQADLQTWSKEFRGFQPRSGQTQPRQQSLSDDPGREMCGITKDMLAWFLRLPVQRAAPLMRSAMLATAPVPP